ncbi:MAG: 6-hydroxymethylpterin diphosphokinase MptE-like protein [Pseudomonadota bacterium]
MDFKRALYRQIKKLIVADWLPYELLEERLVLVPSSRRRLQRLRNRFAGERCFIIGNGPSLNEHDLSKLDGEYSFGVNSIFYKFYNGNFKPTFYVVEDGHVMTDRHREIDAFECDYRFFPKNYRRYIRSHRSKTYFFNMNEGFYIPESPHHEVVRFSTDASRRVYCGQSVTIINLQLAYYLGFSEVYLIGMDFSYAIPESVVKEGHSTLLSTEDDVNHFHPDYFGKGKRWNDPKLHNVKKSYELAKVHYELDGRVIYNATKGGELDVFDRRDYDTLF